MVDELESFVASNERRSLPIHSIHNFKRAPFDVAPPTHLPIGFLFWFHILLLIIITLVAVFTRYANLSDYDYKYYSDVYAFFGQEMTWRVFWKIGLYSLAGTGSSFMFLLIWGLGIWVIPLLTIWISLVLCLVFSILVVTLSFYYRFYFIGSIMILLVLSILFSFVYHRKHLRSTCALYSRIILICRSISVTIWIFLLFSYSLIYVGWGAIITIAFMSIQQFSVLSDFLGLLSLGYVIFSWYWTTKSIRNMGGVITGSIVGKWYFYQSDPMSGLKSGIDTSIGSLGSICLGSLLIPPISVVEAISKSLARVRGQGVESIIYSQCNRYAYTHICIYGNTLFDASVDAKQTFKQTGILNILEKCAIGMIGTIAAIATGSIGSIVAGILGICYTDYGGTLIVVGFLTGYGLADVIVEILDSAVLVLLMCMCEDTSSISNRVPSLEQYLRERYSEDCASLFSRT